MDDTHKHLHCDALCNTGALTGDEYSDTDALDVRVCVHVRLFVKVHER